MPFRSSWTDMILCVRGPQSLLADQRGCRPSSCVGVPGFASDQVMHPLSPPACPAHQPLSSPELPPRATPTPPVQRDPEEDLLCIARTFCYLRESGQETPAEQDVLVQPGDWVWIKIIKRKQWSDPRWEGPYQMSWCTTPNYTVEVEGFIPYGCKRFAINLGKDASNLVIHFNPRFDHLGDKGTIVLNSMKDGYWENEQKEGFFPFQEGSDTKVRIQFENNKIIIHLPVGNPLSFPVRFLITDISYISVEDLQPRSIILK